MGDTRFRDYIKVLVRWRRLIIVGTLVVTGAAVCVSLVLPKRYTATAVLLPPVEASGFQGLTSLLGDGSLSGLGGIAGILGVSSTSDVFAAILTSDRILGEVVRKHNLFDLYGTESLQDAISTLGGKTHVGVSPEGLVFVSVTARHPELSAEIANSLVEELDRFNRETSMTVGRRQRIFLEERLREVGESLGSAENALKEFKENHRTVSLSEELTQAIEAAAQLKAEIAANEIQLGVLREYATESNPEVKKHLSRIGELKRELRKMEYGQTSESNELPLEFGAGFSVPFAKLPEVGLELARLMREAKIQGEIYALLTEQYEQAKIAEVKDTPTVQVLDKAVSPDRRSFPQRKKIVVAAGILSLLASVGAAYFLEYLEDLRKRPEDYRDWKETFGPLRGDFRSFRSALRNIKSSLRRK